MLPHQLIKKPMKGPKQTPVKMQTTEFGAKGMLQRIAMVAISRRVSPSPCWWTRVTSSCWWAGLGVRHQCQFRLVDPDEDDGEDHHHRQFDDGSLELG